LSAALAATRIGDPPGAAGAAAPQLWIHGLGEAGAGFATIARPPRLAGRRHLLPDLPGYGATPPGPEPTPLAGVADALAAWLEAQGERAAIALGHSQGAVIALLLAERHPARVRALIDIEGNKSEGDCGYSAPIAAFDLASFEARGHREMCERAAGRAAADPAQAGYAVRMRRADTRTLHAHARELVALSRQEGLAGRLGALSLPRLFVNGAPRGCPPRSLELADAAGVRRVEIGPAGHWPFVDQPDAFADAVAAQLAEWAL
jgi:pimeloyl-ACP methyl ester carboxylesterase